jgi:hypothetical protein
MRPSHDGLDVHQATISAVVLDSIGKLIRESIIETKAASIPQFVGGLRGNVQVTLEEGTCAAWLHDLLKPHVANVVIRDPRKNALLKAGDKNDRIDARKVPDLLRTGLLSPVYHAENGVRASRELARGYLALNRDVTRVMALRVSELMASLRQAMKTAGRRNPNRWATVPCTPSQWRGRSEPISLDHLRWETRKTPAAGDVFFLPSPFSRELATNHQSLAESNPAKS